MTTDNLAFEKINSETWPKWWQRAFKALPCLEQEKHCLNHGLEI